MCKMKIFLLKLVGIIALVPRCQSSYVPGTPGGEWSPEEVEIVRGRVWQMLEKMKGRITKTPVSEVGLLRLAFHDCLTYKDGTGGCDGCLNWKVMNVKAPSPFPSMPEYCNRQFAKPETTNNNGLNLLAEQLEMIYTTPDWPTSADPMPDGLSLFETGKSRADLWQFAALVGLESTIERSDFACRHDYWQRQQVPLLEGVNKGLGHAFGIWKCKFKLHDHLATRFKHGRKDCIPDHEGLPEASRFAYATMKEENQENPHENAPTLLDNVRKNLGMSSRDFIALMSIHGLIHPFQDGSIGSKYAWVGSGPYLSNMYYKSIVNRPTYYVKRGFDMMSGSGENLAPYSLGDKDGNPVAFWGYRVSCSKCWNTTYNGESLTMSGPCYFRPTKVRSDCPNQGKVKESCFGGWNEDNSRAVKDDPSCQGVTFTPEGIQVGDAEAMKEAPKRGTYGWSNMFALNWEVGMALKFDLDPINDRAINCPGIELDDVTGTWEGTSHSNAAYMSPRADCSKQDYIDPEEKKPIRDIMEEFADDHDVWARDFMAAWHRMAQTGYHEDELKTGPQNSWFGYYKAKDLVEAEGNNMPDYAELIDSFNDKGGLVVNRENIDPYVCGNHANRCVTRVSVIYQKVGIPIAANGRNCTTLSSCNDPTWG